MLLLARLSKDEAFEKDRLDHELGEVFKLGFPICMKKKWIAL